MAGLLDNYGTDPLGQGLLALGASMMTPRAMGGGIGPGLLAFNRGAMQAQQYRRALEQDARRNKLTDAQIAETLAQADERKRKLKLEDDLQAAARSAYIPAVPDTWEGPGVAGGFDRQRFLDEVRKVAPFKAMELEQKVDPRSMLGKIDPKDYTPDSFRQFMATGRAELLIPARKREFVNGVAVDAFDTPVGTTVRNPDELAQQNIIPDGRGGYIVNPLAVQAKKEIAAAGATRVSTPTYVNTEKTYGGEIAQGLAKQDVETINVARGAAANIEAAHRVKQLLGQGAFTGTGAQFTTAIGKALATAGLIDGQRVKTTEDLASELAAATLGEIQSSGLGSGQGFTNKDREFLQDAKSGRIELNAGTIYRLADLRERSARAAIKRANQVGEQLRGDPKMGSVGQTIRFDDPPKAPAMALPQQLTPQNLIIGAEYDLGKHGRGRWNGMAFDPVKD